MVCESVRASNEQQVLTGSKQRRAKPKAAVLRLLQWGVVYMLGPTRTREDGHAFSCAARRGGGYECYCY